jgi:hypothetical protein
MGQLVVGTPFWEKQAAEVWVSCCDDYPEDRVLYGALYAVLMAWSFVAFLATLLRLVMITTPTWRHIFFVLFTVPYSHKSPT